MIAKKKLIMQELILMYLFLYKYIDKNYKSYYILKISIKIENNIIYDIFIYTKEKRRCI